MVRLCAALGYPERRLPPVIHVAGTNGKGSTTAFLRAFAEAQGLKVHVYTSPHLVRFAERIRIAGRLISEPQLQDVLQRVETANAGGPITFFEVTTAVALLAFSETPADLCLLEVGLGGVLDATNVIARPEVAVIAPIDLDHREFLGDTIEQIAAEKCGIIKPGAPVIVGRQAPEAFAVIERRAAGQGAPLLALGRDFDGYPERGRLVFQAEDRLLDLPLPALIGAHQIDNASLAIAAALALGRPALEEAAIARGLQSVRWPARMQPLDEGPLGLAAKAADAKLILDGGHNPHAARALAAALADLDRRDPRPLVLIVGLLSNKDADAFFAELARLAPTAVLTTGFTAEAATDANALASAARQRGLSAQACADFRAAFTAALALAPRPRVVICGSLYLAGEVLALSRATWPE